jgi:hypothetical protein
VSLPGQPHRPLVASHFVAANSAIRLGLIVREDVKIAGMWEVDRTRLNFTVGWWSA